ncbi:MAG: isoprenyl transferase [Bacilli bacterium]
MNIEEIKRTLVMKPLPQHIGIILDGNGRWATKRMLPRIKGHEKGVKTLREIVLEVKELKIPYLTVFAFSTENWNRPQGEVDFLMNQVKKYYYNYFDKLLEQKIKVCFIGFKERIPQDVLIIMEEIEQKTKEFNGFTLTIAFNYGSTKEIVEACRKIATDVAKQKITISNIDESLFESYLFTKDLPPLDFIIRTSGEMRLSNFMLYQAAYAEMYFPKTLWPDFHKKELYIALLEYQSRNRRFGGLNK